MSASDSSLTERKERWARKMSGKAKPAVRSQDRLPPGQHLTPGFPVLDLGLRPEISSGEWRLEIGGLVENPQTLTWEEFNALPQFEDVSDFHCVTTWSKFGTTFTGVSVDTLLEQAGPLPEAAFVMAHATTGYTTNLPLEDVTDGKAWVVWDYEGRPLPVDHGGPVRLLVPHLYFWKSAKWVTRLELMAQDRPGFWEQNGYHMHGDPWREERFGW